MPFLRSHEYHANRFHERQEIAWLAYKSGLDVVIDWGRRCIIPESKVLTPDGLKAFGDISDRDRVLSFHQRANQFRFSKTGCAFPKTKSNGYRVIHDQGEFVVSEHHMIFCADYKYRAAHEMKALFEKGSIGKEVSFLSPFWSIEELYQKASFLNALRLKRIPEDFWGHYGNDNRQCGQQLHQGEDSDPGQFQQKFDVLKSYQFFSSPQSVDTQGETCHNLLKCTHLDPLSCLNAIQDEKNLDDAHLCQKRLSLDCGHGVVPSLLQSPKAQQLSASFLSANITQESWRLILGQFLPYRESTIEAIEPVSSEWFWDVEIPGDNNYVSGGAIHHNSGKTELIAEVLIEDTEEYGRDSMYIALTQGQAREILWQKLVHRIGNRTRYWKSNESRLEWKHKPSNAIISLKGADLGKDKLRGGAKRLIALDEFAFYRDPSIVKDVLVPQLADYNGQLIYTSTPRGKNHFYELKQRALRNPSKFFTSHCTVFENPFIDPAGREKLLAEYSGTDDPLYRQEILAEYVVFNGLAFALPQDSYTCPRWDHADMEHSYHWRGVDHGFSPDPTACLWMAYNRRKGSFLIYNEYKQSRLLIKQHTDVINGLENFHFVETYSDIDPQLIAEYEAVGLSMAPAQKADKQARILRLVNALRTGKLKISNDCVELLKEMNSYEWEQDGNDHLIDALNYIYNNAQVPEPIPQEQPFDYFARPKTFNNQNSGQDFG